MGISLPAIFIFASLATPQRVEGRDGKLPRLLTSSRLHPDLLTESNAATHNGADFDAAHHVLLPRLLRGAERHHRWQGGPAARRHGPSRLGRKHHGSPEPGKDPLAVLPPSALARANGPRPGRTPHGRQRNP